MILDASSFQGNQNYARSRKKILTIPKLELQAAVIAAPMKMKIVEEIWLGIHNFLRGMTLKLSLTL